MKTTILVNDAPMPTNLPVPCSFCHAKLALVAEVGRFLGIDNVTGFGSTLPRTSEAGPRVYRVDHDVCLDTYAKGADEVWRVVSSHRCKVSIVTDYN